MTLTVVLCSAVSQECMSYMLQICCMHDSGTEFTFPDVIHICCLQFKILYSTFQLHLQQMQSYVTMVPV
jgi:hypothetical protein